LEECNKAEDLCIKELLKVVGLEKIEDIPTEFKSKDKSTFDEVLAL